MPVTIRPSDRAPESWGRNPYYTYPQASSPAHLLQCTLSDEGGGSHRQSGTSDKPALPATAAHGLLQSSFAGLGRESRVFAAKNGLVHACIEAYNHHHNLVLRPDDVWLAILAQLGIHVRANAARLRHLFFDDDGGSKTTSSRSQNRRREKGQQQKTVDDEMQKEALHIEIPLTAALDHGEVAVRMTKLVADRLRLRGGGHGQHLGEEGLREWALPAFSTTEKPDQAVAAVLLLGAARRYFTYSWGTRCGVPRATLLGTADDWALVRDRAAARIGGTTTASFGDEAAEWWRAALRPALDGFVESFRDPGGDAAASFWRAMCCEHRPNGSGAAAHSGWITAFCYWDERGECLHGRGRLGGGDDGSLGPVLIARSDVPMGFATVPVTLLDGGLPIKAEMVAGSVGIKVRSLVEGDDGGGSSTASKTAESRRKCYDTLQPETGWFMYRV